MTIPNFLIIGAQKSGATALYHYLDQHPQIYMSPVKEPHFFTYEGEDPGFRGPGRGYAPAITKIEDYQALFKGVLDETAIGEASTSYIYFSRALERARYHVPNVKLIAVLRDPVERAYSNYLHCVRGGREPLDGFEQALEAEQARIRNGWGPVWHYKQKGFYYSQIRRCFDLFGSEQVRVYLYEDLKRAPLTMIRDVFRFLEVNDEFVPDTSARHNVSGVPKSKVLLSLARELSALTPMIRPWLPSRARQYLKTRVLTAPPTAFTGSSWSTSRRVQGGHLEARRVDPEGSFRVAEAGSLRRSQPIFERGAWSMKPKVSVIIPAYNTEEYIGPALKSVLAQTERDLEVIVVDDASTDTTRQVIESFSDERVKLFVNDPNRGPSFTRNRAIQEASGEWVAPLDSDDWYAPERLEELLRVAQTVDADMIADDVHLIDDGDERPWGTLLSLGGGSFDGFERIGAVEFVNMNIPEKRLPRLGLTKPLIRRSFLLQHAVAYDEAVRGGDEDFHFYLACLLQGARFVILPKPYYFYRDREGSLGSGNGNRLRILDARRASNIQLLQQELVKSTPGLSRALSKRLSALEQSIAYLHVAQPLKQGNLPKVLATVVQDPTSLILFAARASSILSYRLYSRLRRFAGKVAPAHGLHR